MTDRLPSTQLAKQSTERELSAFVQAGLLSEGEQRQLSTAVTSAVVMTTVVKPDAQRHLGRINTLLAVRQDTPISRARETLVELGASYDQVRADFHKYRKMVAEVRVLRAKAQKAREGGDPVQVAEADLFDIQADELESLVAEGSRTFRAAMERITSLSNTYALTCKKAGKETFSEDDFKNEELGYLLQSIIWHAAQTAESRQHTTKEIRPQTFYKMTIPAEARHCLVELGVTEREFMADLQELQNMRGGHNALGPFVDAWAPKFDGWLARVTAKYLERVRASIATNGSLRLERVQKLLNPDAGDKGTQSPLWDKVERSSFIDE